MSHLSNNIYSQVNNTEGIGKRSIKRKRLLTGRLALADNALGRQQQHAEIACIGCVDYSRDNPGSCVATGPGYAGCAMPMGRDCPMPSMHRART